MDPFDIDARHFQRGLVARIAAGDAGALQSLYDLHVAQVHAVAMRIVGGGGEARDVVQDVFIKVWRQAHQYQPTRGEVLSWLVLITRNTAIDRLRRGRRRNRLLEALAQAPDAAENAAFPHDLVGGREIVEGPLAKLSPVQRRALELAFFGGYSQPEIASRMRISVEGVKNHLRRGLLRLRQAIADHD